MTYQERVRLTLKSVVDSLDKEFGVERKKVKYEHAKVGDCLSCVELARANSVIYGVAMVDELRRLKRENHRK